MGRIENVTSWVDAALDESGMMAISFGDSVRGETHTARLSPETAARLALRIAAKMYEVPESRIAIVSRPEHPVEDDFYQAKEEGLKAEALCDDPACTPCNGYREFLKTGKQAS